MTGSNQQATNVATSSGDAGSSQQGGGTPSDATNMGGANGGHSEKHSESGDDGNPFATLLAEFGLTTADIGDYGAEYGDKCRGFKLVLTVNKMEETCKALDTESACEGATTCEKDGHGSCDVASAATMKAVGITFDEKKIEADVKANPAGAKDIIKGAFGQLLKPWNDKNATMKDIEKFTKQCKGKTKYVNHHTPTLRPPECAPALPAAHVGCASLVPALHFSIKLLRPKTTKAVRRRRRTGAASRLANDSRPQHLGSRARPVAAMLRPRPCFFLLWRALANSSSRGATGVR